MAAPLNFSIFQPIPSIQLHQEMRLLIIGASGLVGSHVMAEAKAKGHEVVGTYRNYQVDGLVPLDLGDEAATRALLERVRPDWVVHAAGWTWVDGCEKDPARAFRENCEQPVMVARFCKEFGCRFAYFSTTYVFDGTAGPYTEEDRPSPINVYAKSKWAAEQGIQEVLGGQALIPRVICVWGREAQKKNFVYQVIKAVSDGKPMRIPSDQEGNPTWAGDIAAWLVLLMTAGEHGVWNLVGALPCCSREQWLREILSGLQVMDTSLFDKLKDWRYETLSTETLGQPAKRPLRAGGDGRKIHSRFQRMSRSSADISNIL